MPPRSARRSSMPATSAVNFKVEDGIVDAVKDVSFQLYRGETIAIVGESGSGKSVTARTVMGLLTKRATVAGHSSIEYDGKNVLKFSDRAAPGAARQPHLDDLPGADELAEPGLYDRRADHRGDPRPPEDEPQAGDGAGAGASAPGADSRSRSAPQPVSAPAFRRPAPARHDRHGARQQPGRADRRRADDRARRHRAGADPQPDPRSAEEARHGGDPDHP